MTIALCAALCSQQPLTAPHRIAHLHNPLTALHRLASTSTTQHFNFSFTLGSIFFSSHACVDLASCALFAFDNSKSHHLVFTIGRFLEEEDSYSLCPG
ncbi:hypothetical protein JHK82_019488 [Glycine max]|nr:hypothetical protein JHK85_019928 [Glycine max]KAG5143793.1 hypothetical protein JHK82_019488 [Glycine max]